MSSAYPPMDSGFERKEYVVTNLCEKFLTPFSPLMCFSLKQRLILEPEEAILITSTCCSESGTAGWTDWSRGSMALCAGTANERRPYGELGSVDKITACGVCATFQFRSASVSPGWGCSDKLVEDIVTELKARMKARGDTSQVYYAFMPSATSILVSRATYCADPAGRTEPR